MKLLGFTLLETLIVISIILLIGLYSITFNLTSLVRSEVTDERDTFVSLLAMRSRSAALVNKKGFDHGIHIDPTNRLYVLFPGTHYDATELGNVIIPFVTRDTSIQSSRTEPIVFERLSGNVTSGNHLITFSNGEITHTVEINTVGRINW